MTDFEAKVIDAFNSCAIGDYFATRHDPVVNRTDYLWKVTEDTCWWAYSKETMLSETKGEGWLFHGDYFRVPIDSNLHFNTVVTISDDEIWE